MQLGSVQYLQKHLKSLFVGGSRYRRRNTVSNASKVKFAFPSHIKAVTYEAFLESLKRVEIVRFDNGLFDMFFLIQLKQIWVQIWMI